ncbi:hypothetical protein ACOSQ3_031491 [Xanthoceras sorbifolium]
MAATDIEKINIYAPLSTDEHTPEIDGPAITGPTSDSPQPVDSPSTNEKKKKKEKEKRKGAYFFCCSNVEFDTEDDKAKALKILENSKSRSCVTVCF